MTHSQQLINTLQDMSRMISQTHKKFQVYDNFYDLVLREGQIGRRKNVLEMPLFWCWIERIFSMRKDMRLSS